MKNFVRAAMIVLTVLLLTPLLACAIEYRPGEREAEYLFNHGIGKPWIGGNPPCYPYCSWPAQYYAPRPNPSYPLRGYYYADRSYSLWSRSEGDRLMSWPGSHPLRRHYDGSGSRGAFFSYQAK